MTEATELLNTYNRWFISAIKSSKVNGELNAKKLLENCMNCYDQVSSSARSNGQFSNLYEEFRLDSTVYLILGSNYVRSLPALLSSEELVPVINSVPVIEDIKLLHTLKGLKNYKYLRGILPWLPSSISSYFLNEFLKVSNTPSPLVLAFTFEFFFCIFYTLYSEGETYNLECSLGRLEQFLKSKNFNETEVSSKLGAYYFYYVLEILYLSIKILFHVPIEEPYTASMGLKFKNLNIKSSEKVSNKLDSIVSDFTKSLLQICNKYITHISSNAWIEWHSINTPESGFFPYKIHETSTVKKSIQQQVAHTIFSILKILKEFSNSSTMQLQNYGELLAFFNSVGVDPDYDPDTEMNNIEIINCIQKDDADKTGKLLSILLSRDDIWNCEESLKCVKQYGGLLPKSVISPFTGRLIDHLTEKSTPVLEGWKKVVLEVCKKLSSEDIVPIIQEKLNEGRSECLRSSDFISDLTQVFNQLSDQSDVKNYDSFVWLCLQSGIDVVKYAVEMVFSLPGTVHVVTPALKAIHFVCRAKIDNGCSLLNSQLNEKLKLTNTTSEKDSGFESLVLSLLGISEDDDCGKLKRTEEDKNRQPIDVYELFSCVICPRLNFDVKANHEVLPLLNVLKRLVTLYPEVTLKEKHSFSSLVVCLLLFLHNSSVLCESDYVLKLNIRQSIDQMLRTIQKCVILTEEEYCREIRLVRNILSQYELHPRCLNAFKAFNTFQPSANSHSTEPLPSTVADRLFSLITNDSYIPQRKSGSPMQDITSSAVLPKCARIEWVWALYRILPDCSEDEWLISIYLSHYYLNNNNNESTSSSESILSTLITYYEVFVLICREPSSPEKSESELTRSSSLSLRHCFRAFANSAMKFITNMLKNENKFAILADVFTWWCQSQTVLKCDTELPCLFLNDICGFLSDLIQSMKVVVKISSKKSKRENKKQVNGDSYKLDVENLTSQVHELSTGSCSSEDGAVSPVCGQVDEVIHNVHNAAVSNEHEPSCGHMKDSSHDPCNIIGCEPFIYEKDDEQISDLTQDQDNVEYLLKNGNSWKNRNLEINKTDNIENTRLNIFPNHFSHLNLHDDYDTKESHKTNSISSNHSKNSSEIITRKSYDKIINKMIQVFVRSVYSNPISSAIASKLKNLSQLK